MVNSEEALHAMVIKLAPNYIYTIVLYLLCIPATLCLSLYIVKHKSKILVGSPLVLSLLTFKPTAVHLLVIMSLTNASCTVKCQKKDWFHFLAFFGWQSKKIPYYLTLSFLEGSSLLLLRSCGILLVWSDG